MTRVALINDTHFGVRNDHAGFHRHIQRFFDDVFFPYIDREKIQHVVHLGDLLDKRKITNNQTLYNVRVGFLEPLAKRRLITHFLLGNHDVFYRNTNEVSSVREILVGYPFDVYGTADEITIDGRKILLLPWICDENRSMGEEMIRQTDAQVVLGHLELAGFEMGRGQPLSHGDDAAPFSKFRTVASGHYHHRSSKGNVHYLGTQVQLTWSDHGDVKGFHVLDTDTLELEFVPNPSTVFEKLWYDDSEGAACVAVEPTDAADRSFEDKVVKVIVKAKTDPLRFENCIRRIEEQNPIDLQVVEDHLNAGMLEDEDHVDMTADTLSIFQSAVASTPMAEESKSRVSGLLSDLYAEAMAVEN